MKNNYDWQKVEEEVNEKFPLEKYRSFCEMVLDAEMRIDYLKSDQGKEAVGAEKALETIKQEESLIRRIKAQKNAIRNYFS